MRSVPRAVRLVRHPVRHAVRHQVVDFVPLCGMCGKVPHACAGARARVPARARMRAHACMPHIPHMAHWRGFMPHGMAHPPRRMPHRRGRARAFDRFSPFSKKREMPS